MRRTKVLRLAKRPGCAQSAPARPYVDKDRIKFDESGRLVVNLRGYAVRRQGDLKAIAARVEALCVGLGQKVDIVAWYDVQRRSRASKRPMPAWSS